MAECGLQEVVIPPDRLEVCAVGAFFFSDQRPLEGAAGLLDWRLGGMLTRQLQQGLLSGTLGEQAVFRSNGKIAADWVLFLGVGSLVGFDTLRQVEALKRLWQVHLRAGWDKVAVAIQQADARIDRLLQPLAEQTWDETPTTARPTGLLSTDRSWIRRTK